MSWLTPSLKKTSTGTAPSATTCRWLVSSWCGSLALLRLPLLVVGSCHRDVAHWHCSVCHCSSLAPTARWRGRYWLMSHCHWTHKAWFVIVKITASQTLWAVKYRTNEWLSEWVAGWVGDVVWLLMKRWLLYIAVQQLTSDLQAREARFNMVQDRGEALIMERHPASNIIRVSRHQPWCIVLSLLLYRDLCLMWTCLYLLLKSLWLVPAKIYVITVMTVVTICHLFVKHVILISNRHTSYLCRSAFFSQSMHTLLVLPPSDAWWLRFVLLLILPAYKCFVLLLNYYYYYYYY